MHSFVARLRARAISQTTTNSNQSEELPDTPDTTTFPHPLPSSTDTRSPIVDRKILPQVNELLESYSIEDRVNLPSEQSAGLSPRPLRHGLQQSPDPEPSDSSSEPQSAPVNVGKGSIARISRKLASSTPWSTFGRATSTARLSQLDRPPSSRRFHFGSVDTFANPRPSQSTTSVAYGTDSPGSFDHQRRPSRASEASSWRFGSSRGRPSNPLSAIAQDTAQSSRPTTASGRTSVKDSATSRSSNSTKSHAHTPTIPPPPMPSSPSSRQTFENTSPSLHLSAFATPQSSPIPTMDALAPTNTSVPYPQVTLRDTTNTPPRAIPALRHWTSSLARTYPPRRRRKTVGCEADENTVPFPPTSGRRLRTSASVPGVRRIFQHHPLTPKLGRHHQPSPKSSRRSSADWSARQATAGVTSGTIAEYGWPAQVSREMIRMSLGETTTSQASQNKVADKRLLLESANADIIRRGHNVPRSSQVAGRPCPPLVSTNSSPSNIEGDSESGGKPSSPQDGQTDIPVFNKPGGVIEGQRSMSARNGVELSTLKEEGDEIRQAVTLPRASIGSRVYRKSILRHSSSLNPQDSDTGPSSLDNALTSTPKESRRSSARRPARYASEPSISQIPETPTKNKGKRKAEDLDLTPPDNRISHTTFVIPPGHRRTHLQSEPSRAPITYQHKRVRLSSQSPASTPSHSRPGSLQHAAPSFTDSPLYRLSNPPPSPAIRAISRATSTRSMQPSAVATSNPAPSLTDSRRERRRSVSEISFPIGAIVSPQPPSISRSSAYHMRDPRRPPRTHSTPWTPHLKSVDDEASPIHAWLFYVSFILFPLWWIASFLPIPRTRVVGGSDTEKAVPLDDPQIEHDARTWRFRCRIMAGISFLTYIPFIVLVAVFASR